jgi:hypothetical protein
MSPCWTLSQPCSRRDRQPLGTGGFAELAGFDLGTDEIGDGIVDEEELVDGDTTAVAFLVALDTAARPGWRRCRRAADGERLGHFLAQGIGDSGVGFGGEAMAADAADEALGDAADEGGADQERLDIHLEEAGDGADAVVGVEGREDEMAGLGGADGDFGGFDVADFADEDDIGVMAEDAAEAGGEGEADVFAGLDLGDALELVFDGILDGDDFAFAVVGMGEGGVEGGGFAAAGGAGEEDHALGEAGEIGEEGFLVGFHAELAHVQEEVLAAEDPEADGLAVFGGDDGDAEVVFFAGGFHGDATVVGESFFGDIEAGHDFQARDDGAVELAEVGGDGDVLEQAVDAIFEADGGGIGFEVDIGGLEAEGFEEDLVDEISDGGIDGGVFDRRFDVEDDLLVELVQPAFGAQALDGFGAEAEVGFDGGVDGAGVARTILTRFPSRSRRLPSSICFGGSLKAMVNTSPSIDSGIMW